MKTTSTITRPVAEVAARDVRFSSPLERSPANGTASKDSGSRSSLKRPANIDISPAQPLIQAKVHSESAMETLEIVVHPVSQFQPLRSSNIRIHIPSPQALYYSFIRS